MKQATLESHTPRFGAQVLINDLRNALFNEMVKRSPYGIV
jgi:hypothetical protein